MLDDWSAATGKVAVHVEISSRKYEEIWGPTGGDIAAQLKFGEMFEDWTAHVRERFVGREELGIREKEVVGTREAMERTLEKNAA